MMYLENKKRISFYAKGAKLALLICCFVFVSCGDSEDDVIDDVTNLECGTGIWTGFVETELNVWLTASQNYALNPTVENCNNFKTAGQAYIKALESAKDCIPAENLAEYEEELQEAKTEIDEFSCQ